ncbi:MAG: FTR1 family protein [Thermoleophilia bacterium]|nr:FTR1 family protein [Thermoleophilia bacterium]
MGEALLITLREGFEAALIVAIVLAAVSRGGLPGLRRWVWIGAAGAVVLSLAIGLVLHLTIDDLTGVARLRTFALICLAAAGLLTWMVFWMRGHARSLKADLEDRVQGAASQSALALAGVAFVAVAREGLETALFLVSSTTASSGGQVLTGGLIGLAVAVALGAAVYHGSRVVPLGVFFQVTGVLIIAFAAGLLSRAVQFLQAAGDLGTLNDAAYNLTGLTWLTVQTESGRFLAGILGWDPRPSAEQVAVYVLYLVPVLVVFFRGRPRRPRNDPVPSPEGAGAATG